MTSSPVMATSPTMTPSPSGMAELPDDVTEPTQEQSASGRTHYTAVMKLRAIEYAEIHGNRATGRALGIDESSIRKWRQSKDNLAKLSPRIAKHPELEQQLKAWVTSQQRNGRSISVVSLRFRALALARQASIQFDAGSRWALRFLRRCGLRTRKNKRGVAMIDGPIGRDDPELLPIDQDERLPDFVDPKFQERSPDGAAEVDDDEAEPVTGNGCDTDEPSSQQNFHLELLNKFRNCELRILGTTSNDLDFKHSDLNQSQCELCGQMFRFKKPVKRGLVAATPSIRDLRICMECMAGWKLVGQLARPATEDRLRSLESALDAINAHLNLPERAVGHDREVSSVSKLRRENAELKRKLQRYERTEPSQVELNGRKGTNKKSPASEKKVAGKHRRPSTPATPKPVDSFPCPECPQLFTSQSTLQRHLKRHPDRSTFAGDEEDNEAAVAAVKNTIFRCSLCSESFVQRGPLQVHIRKYHPRQPPAEEDSNVDDLLCSGCGKSFANRFTLRRHRPKCLPEPAESEEEPVPEDDECDESADDPRNNYLELAELLEPNMVIGEPEMMDGEESVVMMDQFNRQSHGVVVKLEPVEDADDEDDDA